MGDLIQSRESGNGEAADRCPENHLVVLFWNSSTWKVSLGITFAALFWPCQEPIPVVYTKFFRNVICDAEKTGVVAKPDLTLRLTSFRLLMEPF